MASATDHFPRLHVRLIGELEVRPADGPPVALPPSRRTRALLGYLLATRIPHSRSSLCDLLWDGSDDPRAALRWSLTKLRPMVDDAERQRLQADRERVGFNTSDSLIDSRRVDALLPGPDLAQVPLATLEEAAQALQGEFLDGLELPACYRFHHWWMAERERHARRRRAVLGALIARLQEDPGRAVPWGRAMVRTDPLAEPAHATLVRLLAAAGHYAEAEAHYAYARDLLRREVALPDGGELDATIRAVRRRQREAASRATATATATAMSTATATATPTPSVEPGDPPAGRASPDAQAALSELTRSASVREPLVGRARECAVIETAIAAPTRAPLLLLLGEPGIGKTRLLDHAAQRAVAGGFGLIRAGCHEAEAIRPYGVWIDALRGVATEGLADGVRAAVSPLTGGPASAISRDELFGSAAMLLERLASRQPRCVLIDDLQWIDEASAALLHFMVRRLAETSPAIVFAFAARAGEVDDNPAARTLLQSLARVRELQRLPLQPLAEPDVRRWLGDRLSDLPAALRDSGGNPLFLLELARARRDVADAPAGHAWEPLIAHRLEALDAGARDLLGWAATSGGPFAAERLADASGLPLPDLLARIALLERRGMLRDDGDGRIDFTHGLVRQAVYRSLSMARRRAQHRRLARALSSAAVEDPWLHGQVVHHASLAGDAPVAARAALAAGEHWLRVFAHRDAALVAERGLALLESLAHGPDRSRLEVGLLRLRVAAAAAAPGGLTLPDPRERLQRAIATAQTLGLHDIASSGWEILAYWCQQTGDSEGARSATLSAERCARLADALTRCQQLANTGRCLIDIEADLDRGRALLDDADTLASELQLPLMELEWGRGLAARADGDLERARATLERAVELAQAAAHHWREYECRLALATVQFELGQDDAVLRNVEAVADAARRMGELQVPFANALAALSRRRLGQPQADAAVAQTLAALRQRDAKAHLAYALNVAADMALASGAGTTAIDLATEALAAAEAVRRPSLAARARATLAAAAPAAGSGA